MSLASLSRAIPPVDRVLIDASAFIPYLDRSERVSPLAVHVMDEFVRGGRNAAIISMVSIMEVLIRPLRQGAPAPYRHVLDLLVHFPNLQAMNIDLVVAQEAVSLRASYNFSAPDALTIATGVVAQVGHLVTNDQDWRRKLRPLARRIGVCHLADHLPFP